MFVLARALTYATLFVGFLLVFLPQRIVARAGLIIPAEPGPAQIAGVLLALAGALLALSCVLTFVFQGRGTPAPFDPPRRLVIRGPYAWVRNPMYIGAATALLGAASYASSSALVLYALGFVGVTHLFVVLYEEPTLRRMFGQEYAQYCARVNRWIPQAPRRSMEPG